MGKRNSGLSKTRARRTRSKKSPKRLAEKERMRKIRALKPAARRKALAER